MNSSPISNTQADGYPQLCHPAWTPPEWLLEFSSEAGFVAELIDAFKSSTETSLRQMRAALASANVPKLRSEAHRTKGGARQIGADALAEVCLSLENASCLTPASHLVELVDRCQELFDEAGNEMTSYSNRHESVDDSARLSLGGTSAS